MKPILIVLAVSLVYFGGIAYGTYWVVNQSVGELERLQQQELGK